MDKSLYFIIKRLRDPHPSNTKHFVTVFNVTLTTLRKYCKMFDKKSTSDDFVKSRKNRDFFYNVYIYNIEINQKICRKIFYNIIKVF